MNTLQAHGMTTHELTQNTAGQSQPWDSHGHMTANAMDYTNAKQIPAFAKPQHPSINFTVVSGLT